MRKRVIPLLALFLMLALMPANVAAHTESAPFVTDLIAGGGNDESGVVVGQVLVWNDGENLYVKYVTDECWVILETHLHVAACVEDIPQTKKFNPIPGLFAYSSDALFEDGVTEVEYPIELPENWEAGDEFYIAAHAVVVKICDPLIICDASQEGVAVYGPLAAYYGLNDVAWMSPSPAAETWVHSSWPSIEGAEWISTAVNVENAVDDSWRWFHSEIELPEGGYYLTGSVVTATSDNAEEVYFNGEMVGYDGEVQGAFEDDHEWATILEYPVEPVPGVNNLDFIVRNYYQAGGTQASNPTGLIYKVCFNAYQVETAWGAGQEFNIDKNWATYFKYTVQGWNLEGDWVLRFVYGTNYDHDMTVTFQDADGTFEGIGGYPAGATTYTHPWTVTGKVDGNAIEFTIVYGSGAPNPGYTVWATGTIAADGTMSGTWSSSTNQNGAWSSLSGAAQWTS
ncbi:MAG: hypothetical protein ACFFAX_12585 [Promethearchaeota archaeon]